MLLLGISRLTVGSVSVEADCDPSMGDECSGFAFLVDISEADDEFDFICAATTGSLSITSISNSRAMGTFTGSGSCVNPSFQLSSFTVVNGEFDVALLSESQLPQ